MKKNVGDAPLPGDDVDSYPTCVPSLGAVEKNRQKGYSTGEAFGLNNAAVLTPAVAGVVSVFAGAVAPADLDGMPWLGCNSWPLPRIYPWPMTLEGCPQPSVLVNRSGLLPGRIP